MIRSVLAVGAALMLTVVASHQDRPTPTPASDSDDVSCSSEVVDALHRDGALRHEPRGFSTVTCLHFDGTPGGDGAEGFAGIPPRAAVQPGWRPGEQEHLQVVTDPGPDRDDRVAEARFPRGWEGGYAPVWINRDIDDAQLTRVYLSFRLRISENWQGHPVNDKILYVWTHGKPVVFPVYVGGGSYPLRTEVRIQDVPDGGRNLRANAGPDPIERGRWHRWEVLLVANTGGRFDGEVHWWIDGSKAGQYRDLRFGMSDQSKIWELVSWRPIWGGAGGVVREDQYMWIDDLYVSGAP